MAKPLPGLAVVPFGEEQTTHVTVDMLKSALETCDTEVEALLEVLHTVYFNPCYPDNHSCVAIGYTYYAAETGGGWRQEKNQTLVEAMLQRAQELFRLAEGQELSVKQAQSYGKIQAMDLSRTMLDVFQLVRVIKAMGASLDRLASLGYDVPAG